MMATVFQPATSHSLQQLVENKVYGSHSPFADDGLVRGFQRSRPRSASAASILSTVSLPTNQQMQGKENMRPRMGSRSALSFVHDYYTGTPFSYTPRLPSWHTESTIPSPLGHPSSLLSVADRSQCQDVTVQTTCPLPQLVSNILQDEPQHTASDDVLPNLPTLCVEGNRVRIEHPDDISVPSAPKEAPMSRFLDRIRRRNARRDHRNGTWNVSSPELDHLQQLSAAHTVHMDEAMATGHRQSLSITSSLSFVNAVKSASITLASASIAPRSRRSTRTSNNPSDKRDSRYSDQRQSIDSNAPSLALIVDEKVAARSLQRRLILAEIVATEESYVSDLKALFTVYFTVLAGAPHIAGRESVQRALKQVIQLHVDLLNELLKVVSPTTGGEQPPAQVTVRSPKHARWHSADADTPISRTDSHRAMIRRFRHSIDTSRPIYGDFNDASPDTALVVKVAKIFDTFMMRFFVYKAFVANNTIMRGDAAFTTKTFPAWPVLERGVEALSNSMSPIESQEKASRKALSFQDLLIKPVQRVCKYVLFFKELCKQTPVYDDPVAHELLEKIQARLEETADEVNRATDNAETRQEIEITWRLQDRMTFERQVGVTDVKASSDADHIRQNMPKSTIFRCLGHAELCGVLHVAYESPGKIHGEYMISILYRSYLVLATATEKSPPRYTVAAVVPLLNGSIEPADNGRGLQCYTVPYTWKVVFEYAQRQYELMLSGCSEKEESMWMGKLREKISTETGAFNDGRYADGDSCSYLGLELKSLGPAFRHVHGMERRMSVHRAATLGAKTNLHQVIIKNTDAQKKNATCDGEAPVMRSQSHLSSNPVPILAPRRNDRIRLELAITDVYSQDLVGSGMAPRRPDTPFNTMMRKLSMASIASNFSRRSSGHASISYSAENPRRLSTKPSNSSIPLKRPSSAQKKLVDFHNTPEDFLPEDFELRQKTETKRRRGLTMAAIGEQQAMPASTSPSTSVATGLSKTLEPPSKAQKREDSPAAWAMYQNDGRTGPSLFSTSSPARTTKMSRSADDATSRASSGIESAPPTKRLAKSRSLFLRLSARWSKNGAK